MVVMAALVVWFGQEGRRVASALGQKQTCALQKGMSALPPRATEKADILFKNAPRQKRLATRDDRRKNDRPATLRATSRQIRRQRGQNGKAAPVFLGTTSREFLGKAA